MNSDQGKSRESVLEAEVAELRLERDSLIAQLERLKRLPDKVGDRCWAAQMDAENNLRLLKLMEQERNEVLEELESLRVEHEKAVAQTWELGCERDAARAERDAALNAPCVTSFVPSNGEHPICVYLRDGTKIVVARDKRTKGPVWLEHKPQAKIGIAGGK